MKPDWKDAPEWAMWAAMDHDKTWWWYENKPEFDSGIDRWMLPENDYGKCTPYVSKDPSDSLERRP